MFVGAIFWTVALDDFMTVYLNFQYYIKELAQYDISIKQISCISS